jgi:hypothetical protein
MWPLYVLALSGLLLLAAAAATWILVPPPQPSARADLLVEPSQPFVLQPIDNSRQSGEEYIKSQAMLIKNQGLVIVPALRPPNAKKGTEMPAKHIMDLATLREVHDKGIDVYQWLEDKLQVEPFGTHIMRISLAGDHPKELAEIVKAITEQYLYFLEKDRNRNQEALKTLKRANERYLNLAEDLRKKLSAMAKGQFNFDNPENVMISFRIMMHEVHPVYAELVKAQSELRHLHIELRMNSKRGEDWERFTSAMNCLPGSGLPVNHALVLGLHDRSAVLNGTLSAKTKWERYAFLQELIRTLEPEVKRLKDAAAGLRRGDPVAPSLQQELEMYDKLVQKTRERIELLNLELHAPPRIIWPGEQVTIHTPDTRLFTLVKVVTAAAAAAVGIALLVLAWRGFRNRSSAPALPNTPS